MRQRRLGRPEACHRSHVKSAAPPTWVPGAAHVVCSCHREQLHLGRCMLRCEWSGLMHMQQQAVMHEDETKVPLRAQGSNNRSEHAAAIEVPRDAFPAAASTKTQPGQERPWLLHRRNARQPHPADT